MKKTSISKVFYNTAVSVIALVLVLLSVSGSVSAAQLNLVAADVGYFDFSYGTVVKPEPTADNPESKLWFNDGIWWSVMFDDATDQYAIYKLNSATQVWTKTATSLDSRNETTGTPPVASGTVDTRFDALWDGTNLYLASHIRKEVPGKVNSSANWAQLSRYSYNAASDTYSQVGSSVTINEDKTATLVLDKDLTGRLWATYVSKEQGAAEPFKVFLNYSTTDAMTWSDTPIDLSSLPGAGGPVNSDDISSVVTYADKVGVMWSDQNDTEFYYAETTADATPTSGWTVTQVLPAVLSADDHIKLVANNDGEVFAAIKTADTVNGLLARNTGGTFFFKEFSTSPGLARDTHPTVAYNSDTDTAHFFVVSNEIGGVVCHDSTSVANLAAMSFSTNSCDPDLPGNHFIANVAYDNVNNPTTTKRPFNNASGLVVLANDVNENVYLHNMLGGGVVVVPAVVTTTPADNGTLNAAKVTTSATFNMDMNAASLTAANFTVTGPGGPVAGMVAYNAATRTATFTANANSAAGVYTATLNTNVEAADGTNLAGNYVWDFTLNVVAMNHKIYIPIIER